MHQIPTSHAGLSAIGRDTTALSHEEAEPLHREASAACGAAGRIEAATYHLRLAEWHAASMRKIPAS